MSFDFKLGQNFIGSRAPQESPLALFALLLLLYLGPGRFWVSRDMSDQQLARKAVKRLAKQFWKLVLFTVFLMYPSVSNKVSALTVSSSNMIADLDRRCSPSLSAAKSTESTTWQVRIDAPISSLFDAFAGRGLHAALLR